MANNLGTLTLDLIAKVGGFIGPMDKMDRRVKKSQRGIKDFSRKSKEALKALSVAFVGVATVGVGALTALGIRSVKLASDAKETENKFKAVFGTLTKEADAFVKSVSEGIGRNEQDLKEGLSSFQGFTVGLGFAREEALKMSTQLQSLALDFASFNNLSDGEAQQRFISAMSGSGEVLDRFGINIKAAALDQKLLELGLAESTAKATEQQKAIARLSIIMDTMTSQGAVGDAARTQGEFAAQSKRLDANIKDLTISLGEKLLPKATELITKTNTWIDANEDLIDTKLDEFIDKIIDNADDFKVFLETGIGGMRLLAQAGIATAAAFELTATAIAGVGATATAMFQDIDISAKNLIPGRALFQFARSAKGNFEQAKSAAALTAQEFEETTDKYLDMLKVFSGDGSFSLPDNTPPAIEKAKAAVDAQVSTTEETVSNLKTIMTQQSAVADQVVEDLAEQDAAIQKSSKTMQEFGATFSSATEEAILSGEKLSDVLKGLEKDLIRLALRKYVLEPAFNGIFGGGNQSGLLSTTFSARGNVFAGGSLVPFAQGGILSSAAMFPLGKNRIGVAGESGPEAIIPLKRTRSGDLGVAAQMGGGGTIVNVYAPPGSSVSEERSQDNGMERINIYIDEATAGNIRPGTKTYRALKDNFGLGQRTVQR